MGEEGVTIQQILRGEVNLLENLIGGNVSGDPRIVIPIISAIIIVLLLFVFHAIRNDKGKSEMTEEELAEDRAILRDSLEKQALLKGQELNVAKLDAEEAEAIKKGKILSGKE